MTSTAVRSTADPVHETHLAMLNILEDFSDERDATAQTQRAILNILEDFSDEKSHLEMTQKAVLNILEDFDEEKDKVDRANAQLRAEVGARSEAERALEQRTDELARSNDELETFAYAASHDLSEPLRAISGPATLLAHRYRGELDEEADALIDFVVDGCERMQVLIADLLTYSRVGRVESTFEAVDLHRVVANVLTIVGPRIADVGASIEVGPMPTVQGEPSQLAQVFQNLITNALKFGVADVAPEISVTATRDSFGWTCSVIDNGIGIEPRHRERIFGMFKRLHTRDEYPGTGIGLALVRKIVERHGGIVGVDASPTGGSHFWFTLPITEDDT